MAELEKLVAESEHAQNGRPHGVIPPGDKAPAEQPGEAATTTPPAAPTTPATPPRAPGAEEGRVAATAPPPATVPATVNPPAAAANGSVGAFLRTPAGKAAIAVGALGVGALIGRGHGRRGAVARLDLQQRLRSRSCDDALYQRTHGLAIGTDVMIAVGAVAVATSSCC